MDELTIQLVRVLQDDGGDEASIERVDALLPEVRSTLRAANDSDTLDEFVGLLENLGQREPDDERAAAAWRAAADIAALDLGDWNRGADLYELALQRCPLDRTAFDRLEVLLDEHGEDARREAALMGFAQALDRAEAPAAERAGAYRKLGTLRAERLLDVDTAIAAYSAAVEAEPTAEVIAELAELFQRRADLGDDEEAANLLCRLSSISANDEAQGHLRRALDLVPEHQEALELLEARVPHQQRVALLRDVYEAFVSVAPEGPKVEAVRAALEAADAAAKAGVENVDVSVSAAATSAPTGIALSPSPANSLSPLELSDTAATFSRRGGEALRKGAAVAGMAAVAAAVLLFVGRSDEHEPNASAGTGSKAPVEHAETPTEPSAPAAPTTAEPTTAEPTTTPPEPKLAMLTPSEAPAVAVPSHATGLGVELVEELTRTVGGEVERATLVASVRAALPELTRCYEDARRRLPRLQGRLVFAWTIDASGRAKLVKLMRGTIADKGMRRCVGTRLRATRFTKPSGRPVRVTAPFVFAAH